MCCSINPLEFWNVLTMESALLLVFNRVLHTEALYLLKSWTKIFYWHNTKSVFRPLPSAGTEAIQWSYFVSDIPCPWDTMDTCSCNVDGPNQLGKYKFSNTNFGTSSNMAVVVLIAFNSSTVLLLVLYNILLQ